MPLLFNQENSFVHVLKECEPPAFKSPLQPLLQLILLRHALMVLRAVLIAMPAAHLKLSPLLNNYKVRAFDTETAAAPKVQLPAPVSSTLLPLVLKIRSIASRAAVPVPAKRKGLAPTTNAWVPALVAPPRHHLRPVRRKHAATDRSRRVGNCFLIAQSLTIAPS